MGAWVELEMVGSHVGLKMTVVLLRLYIFLYCGYLDVMLPWYFRLGVLVGSDQFGF